jgi:hypothetical protein
MNIFWLQRETAKAMYLYSVPQNITHQNARQSFGL